MVNKYWTPQTEKIATSLGIGLSGYYILSKTFVSLWQVPAIVTKPLIANVSILTVAAGLAIYGVWLLFKHY